MSKKTAPRDTGTLKTLLHAAFDNRDEHAAIEIAKELGPHLDDCSHHMRPHDNTTLHISVRWHDQTGKIESAVENDWPLPAGLRVAESLGLARDTISAAVEAYLKNLDAGADFDQMAKTIAFLTENPRFSVVRLDMTRVAYRPVRTFRLNRVHEGIVNAWLDAAEKEIARWHPEEQTLLSRRQS